MANQIKMAIRDSIYGLYDRGWAQRRIALTLEVDRETVSRHIRLRTVERSEPAIPPAGNETGSPANPAISPAGSGPPKPSINRSG